MTTTVTKSDDGRRIKVSAGAGETPRVIILNEPGATWIVSVNPGGGGTMSVEASWSLASDINGGGGVWHIWDYGTVSSKTNQVLQQPVAVRFTATTQAGTGEVAR